MKWRRREGSASSASAPAGAPHAAPADVYRGLRRQILELDPTAAGIAPDIPSAPVWGALMDMAYPNGTATLVCVADGTTSLYTSTGGGMIGAGTHPHVAAANRAFLEQVAEHLDNLIPESSDTMPQPGLVILRALTFDGRRAATAPEDDLGYGRLPWSSVFHAGHLVISQLRLLEENPQRS